jgi:hypothetical protein
MHAAGFASATGNPTAFYVPSDQRLRDDLARWRLNRQGASLLHDALGHDPRMVRLTPRLEPAALINITFFPGEGNGVNRR